MKIIILILTLCDHPIGIITTNNTQTIIYEYKLIPQAIDTNKDKDRIYVTTPIDSLLGGACT